MLLLVSDRKLFDGKFYQHFYCATMDLEDNWSMKVLIKIANDDSLLTKNFGQNFAFHQLGFSIVYVLFAIFSFLFIYGVHN